MAKKLNFQFPFPKFQNSFQIFLFTTWLQNLKKALDQRPLHQWVDNAPVMMFKKPSKPKERLNLQKD